MNWDLEVRFRASPETKVEQWGKMAASGVESARVSFLWAEAQPDESAPIDFTATDSLVTLAASHGIELIPIVLQAPRWARQSDADMAPPTKKGLQGYTDYLRAIIDRYGKTGTFWGTHKNLPKRPIKVIQVWNEASADYQWDIADGADWAP